MFYVHLTKIGRDLTSLLQNSTIIPVGNCLLSRFFNRDYGSRTNVPDSFVPDGMEPGQMCFFQIKKTQHVSARSPASAHAYRKSNNFSKIAITKTITITNYSFTKLIITTLQSPSIHSQNQSQINTTHRHFWEFFFKKTISGGA